MLKNPLQHLNFLTHCRNSIDFIDMCGGDMILSIGDTLIHNAQSVAHSAVSQLGNQTQRFIVAFNMFLFQNTADTGHDFILTYF